MSWCFKGFRQDLSLSQGLGGPTQTLWGAERTWFPVQLRVSCPWVSLKPPAPHPRRRVSPWVLSLGGSGPLVFGAGSQLEGRPGWKREEKPSWETWHFASTLPLRNLSFKKSSDAFSFWGKKGAFHCIKQRLVYLDKPLFELPSSADGAQMPTTRIFSACPQEVSGKPLLPKGKNQNLGVWVMWKAQHLGTSFCLGFPPALYWRQTFTKKGKIKGFWEKMIFFDKSII